MSGSNEKSADQDLVRIGQGTEPERSGRSVAPAETALPGESELPLENTLPAIVLVVDDEPTICWAFERMLREDGHRVVSAGSAEDGLELAAEHQPDLILLDVRLPKQDGISAMPKFRQIVGDCPIVVMTAFGDLETAVAAVREGASDYLIKPFRLEDAKRVCSVALRKSRKVATAAPTQVHDGAQAELVGSSPAMQQAFRQIALVAKSDLSVLITGETGTGKELVAAAIHRHSHRASGPYFPIAPVALNADLIESELFGHVQGAFTGATVNRAGLFERAAGGTVLLDEIGELPMNIQVKLLRVLEQGTFTRVGDVEARKCDVRILAATHRDLHQAVREGRFRQDLFYRLNGLQIHLPPLRERTEDLGLLCQHFLRQLNHTRCAEQLDVALLEQLALRPWNGNIRELRNAVGHAAVVASGGPLTIDDFPAAQPGELKNTGERSDSSIQTVIRKWTENALTGAISDNGLYAQLLAEVEPELLAAVLRFTSDNRAKAAELLGIHRGTLREKLRTYDLPKPP